MDGAEAGRVFTRGNCVNVKLEGITMGGPGAAF